MAEKAWAGLGTLQEKRMLNGNIYIYVYVYVYALRLCIQSDLHVINYQFHQGQSTLEQLGLSALLRGTIEAAGMGNMMPV